MSLAQWSLFVGTLLVTMVLAGTLLGRLPLSNAMVYLALGWLLGPAAADVLRPHPVAHGSLLQGVKRLQQRRRIPGTLRCVGRHRRAHSLRAAANSAA